METCRTLIGTWFTVFLFVIASVMLAGPVYQLLVPVQYMLLVALIIAVFCEYGGGLDCTW